VQISPLQAGGLPNDPEPLRWLCDLPAPRGRATRPPPAPPAAPTRAAVRRYNDTMAAPPKPELPLLQFDDPAAWEEWLSTHYDTPGVWLKLAKKNTGVTTVTYAEALEVALCWGWIDGQVGRLDETFYRQRFTPRTKRSKWSQINRRHIERLTAEGRMRPPGQAAVDAAIADGRWEAAYPAASEATVPDDFQAALDANPSAKAFFATLTGSPRYAFLHRLHNVQRPETRARRIAGYIERLSAGRTLD
jgi:uncharacterized protein YdeI (YjbR/CyaY-like superfamily)